MNEQTRRICNTRPIHFVNQTVVIKGEGPTSSKPTFNPDEMIMTMQLFIPLESNHPISRLVPPIKRHHKVIVGTTVSKTLSNLHQNSSSERVNISSIARMKKYSHGQVIGIPVGSSRTYAEEELLGEPACDGVPVCTMKDRESCASGSKQSKDSVVGLMSRFSKKADILAHGIREHVSLGPKFSETVKGKLTLGKRILQAGGIERVFRQSFTVETGEELLKTSQCHLSTSAGPIAGILFISTKKIAFRSDRSLSLSSPKGEVAKVPYKVLIPLEKVKEATESENMNKPDQKYVHIVTVDDFEFWFMGFVNYQRSFKYLKQAISEL